MLGWHSKVKVKKTGEIGYVSSIRYTKSLDDVTIVYVKSEATGKYIDNDGSHMFIESELELING